MDGRERDAFAGAEGDARDEEWRDARGGGFWGDEGGERPREHAEEQDGFSADAIRESSPEELGERVAVEERGEDAALADLIPAELMRHGDDGGADVGAVGVAHEDGGGGEENENAPVAGAVAGDAVAGSRGPDGARVEGVRERLASSESGGRRRSLGGARAWGGARARGAATASDVATSRFGTAPRRTPGRSRDARRRRATRGRGTFRGASAKPRDRVAPASTPTRASPGAPPWGRACGRE